MGAWLYQVGDRSRPDPWVATGVLARGPDTIAFGVRPGFGGSNLGQACAEIVGPAEVDRAWGYWMDRAVGNDSTFGDPIELEAPTLVEGLASLLAAPPVAPAIQGG